MRMRMTALIMLVSLAAAPAALGQDHAHDEAETDAPDRAGMMNMHEGQSMMDRAGMMKMHQGPAMMILCQKEALGLDESQIEQLEELGDQMADMRRSQMESMKRFHADALAVLTEDQRSIIKSGMNGMMEDGMAMRAEGEGMACPMMDGMKEGS